MKLVSGNQMIGIRHGIDILQKYCDTEFSAWKHITPNWTKTAVHASCPFRYNLSKWGSEYLVDRIWYDLDGKIENCLTDLRKLQYLASKYDGDALGFVSRRGIHAHFMIEPIWLDTDGIDRLVLAKRKIITECSLRTVDWSGFGDMSKLPRLPNSVTGPGTFHVQVYKDDWPDDLLKARIAPRAFRYRKKQISLDRLLELMVDVKPADAPLTATQAFKIDLSKVQIKPVTWCFEKPCMQAAMSVSSPPAFARHEAVVRLKKLDWKKDQIELWFKALNTNDFNADTVHYMVNHSYEYEWASSCKTLEYNNLCIGPSCRFFKHKTGGRRWQRAES